MSENEYIGSEEHFQAIQRAAGMTTAEDRKPETLGEALGDLGRAWDDLMKATGFPRLADRVLVTIGRVLIRMGWNDGSK